MKIFKDAADALTSIFRHNFTTSFVFVLLILSNLFFIFRDEFSILSVKEALNLLVLFSILGIGLKSYQLFKKRKV